MTLVGPHTVDSGVRARPWPVAEAVLSPVVMNSGRADCPGLGTGWPKASGAEVVNGPDGESKEFATTC